MEKEEHLERYEALGDESDFLAVRPWYERALATEPSAQHFNDYGYLLACHGRNELRRAVEQFEQAIALDPAFDKPHFQLISARAALQEAELAVALYEKRFAASPGVREHRILASAYIGAKAYPQARAVAEAGLELSPDDGALMTLRGEAKAGLGDCEGALADWKRAVELEPEDIGGALQHRIPSRETEPLEGSDGRLARDHRMERLARIRTAGQVAETRTAALSGSKRTRSAARGLAIQPATGYRCEARTRELGDRRQVARPARSGGFGRARPVRRGEPAEAVRAARAARA